MKPLPPKVSAQRKEVVDAVIKQLDNNNLQWLQEWAAGDAPQNAITGNAYRGVNRVSLGFAARAHGYTDPRWVTFRQAQQMGWHIRKGAKSRPIEKWKSYRIPSLDPDQEDRIAIACVGYYNVFSLEDVPDAPTYDPDIPALSRSDVTDIADRLIATSRCDVRETTEGRACYSPAYDRITIPDRRLFLGSDDIRASNFVRTLAHEMGHSTMVPLARAHDDYAREELVAELTAVFTCGDLGLQVSYDEGDLHFRQHAAYLKSWASHLKDQPHALFTAAALADKASAYILDRYNTVQKCT